MLRSNRMIVSPVARGHNGPMAKQRIYAGGPDVCSTVKDGTGVKPTLDISGNESSRMPQPFPSGGQRKPPALHLCVGLSIVLGLAAAMVWSYLDDGIVAILLRPGVASAERVGLIQEYFRSWGTIAPVAYRVPPIIFRSKLCNMRRLSRKMVGVAEQLDDCVARRPRA